MSDLRSFYSEILKDKSLRIAVGLLLFYSIWWTTLRFIDPSPLHVLIFADSYHITALFGAIVGLSIARKWGGLKSMIGSSIFMFSIGLFCQWFAQVAGAYLVWKVGTVPYPSLSDIGAFGALIFYAIGAIFLAQSSGAHISLRSYRGKFIAALIPILFLSISFSIFLSSYEYDWSYPLRTFLDIGYPLGEAFYVSMAILAYLLSRNVLGGIMKLPILFFIAALISEYVADFYFLYDSYSGAYALGSIHDLLFIISYSLMSISLTLLGVVYKWIKES